MSKYAFPDQISRSQSFTKKTGLEVLKYDLSVDRVIIINPEGGTSIAWIDFTAIADG